LSNKQNIRCFHHVLFDLVESSGWLLPVKTTTLSFILTNKVDQIFMRIGITLLNQQQSPCEII